MHEISLIENLLKILDKLEREHRVKTFLKINMTVNPHSCMDGENLNFIFHSMTRGNPLYSGTVIEITRSGDPVSREFIIDNIEIEQ